jgi:metallophosphoesterase (TIGR00282 family)
MKLLIIGDLVGEPGREALAKYLENRRELFDFIIVNGENVAGGFGITPKIANKVFNLGTNVITLGNHTWDRREIYPYLNETENIIRPLNFAPGTPGKGYTIVEKNGKKLAVINLQGKVFMPPIACPFLAVDELLPKIKAQTNNIIVDFHGEATSEKQAMGWNLDGQVSLVYGTHTHTQTADERILHRGTGYITDIGMTGGHDGILGMNKKESIQKFKDGLPARWSVCKENIKINGIIVDIDEYGKTEKIERLNMHIAI